MKTLENKFGFSIKYPPNLSANLAPIGAEPSRDASNASTVIMGDLSFGSDLYFYVDVENKDSFGSKSLTLEQIVKQSYEANLNNKDGFKEVVDPFKLTSLDGKPAYTYIILSKSFKGAWNISGFKQSNPLRKIKVIESENNNLHYLLVFATDNPTYGQILSTFKFTN